jgi:hypothetical protein
MKITTIALSLALAAGALASDAALADRGGHSRVTFGINLGVPAGPWFYPRYSPPYYPPYYAPYPPIVVLPAYPDVPAQPAAPVYVEKGGDAAGPATSSPNYWYYCTDPQGYYPYVKDCQANWLTVLPQAPAQPQPR